MANSAPNKLLKMTSSNCQPNFKFVANLLVKGSLLKQLRYYKPDSFKKTTFCFSIGFNNH